MKTKFLKLLQFLLALLVYLGFISFVIARVTTENFNLGIVLKYQDLLLEGLKNTLFISACALLLGLILGFILYIGRESNIYFIKSLSNIFIEVMMGTPLLVLVFVTSFFIGSAFKYDNDYILGILALTAYIGPYLANIFKSVISSIDKDQYIIMDLYGFNFYQKYVYIILPQVTKLIMPPLMNNLSYLIKGSSLLYLTAVTEIFYSIKLIQSKSYAFTEGYLVLWVTYLIITVPLSLLTKYIERKYSN